MNPATSPHVSNPQQLGKVRKSTILWALAVVNVALAIVLVLKHAPSQTALAQAARPSDYVMVPGQLTGIPTGVVFILDTSRGELSAMSYDDSSNTLSPMPKISLDQVFKAGAAIGGGGRLKSR